MGKITVSNEWPVIHPLGQAPTPLSPTRFLEPHRERHAPRSLAALRAGAWPVPPASVLARAGCSLRH